MEPEYFLIQRAEPRRPGESSRESAEARVAVSVAMRACTRARSFAVKPSTTRRRLPAIKLTWKKHVAPLKKPAPGRADNRDASTRNDDEDDEGDGDDDARRDYFPRMSRGLARSLAGCVLLRPRRITSHRIASHRIAVLRGQRSAHAIFPRVAALFAGKKVSAPRAARRRG